MLGVEVLELRRVVVLGANRRRQKYTVREPRKMQGRQFATIKGVKRDSQEASKRLQGQDDRRSLRPAFDGAGSTRRCSVSRQQWESYRQIGITHKENHDSNGKKTFLTMCSSRNNAWTYLLQGLQLGGGMCA
jgi:hypothetical protein